ncbi:ATP-binding protein [Aureimonas psammosilenae]|uniref:ATP-binding protein n=1 Tax=Aureimonas psammosilenae TaxID=2495496 RepID=UPI0012606FD3|nr:ATP-binding protein [Aureimonas psammosilenae]
MSTAARAFVALLLIITATALSGCSVRSQDNALKLSDRAFVLADPSGTLPFEDVRGREFQAWSAAEPVRVPDGGAVWLKLSPLDAEALIAGGWMRPFALVVKEPWVRHVDLFIDDGTTVTQRAWDWQDSRRLDGNGYRYPLVGLEPDALQAELFLRVFPSEPLGRNIWITDFQSFFGSYNNETTSLSIAIGILVAVLLYSLAQGATLRNRTTLWFAAVLAAELVHILTRSSAYETQFVPGAVESSIALAFASSFALQGALVGFAAHFLRSGRDGVVVSRLVRGFVAVLLLLALVSLLSPDALRFLHGVFKPATVLVLVTLCALAARRTVSRVAVFALSWAPALVPMIASREAHAIAPAFSDNLVFSDGVLFGLCATNAIFAAIASLDIRQREHALLAQVRHNAERFRGFAEIGTDGFWEVDPEGRLTFLSGRIADPVRLALGDLLLDRLAQHSSADYVRPIRETIADRLPLDGRRIRIENEGSDVWISLSGRAIGDPGGYAGEAVYRGVIRDVTEETERESRRVVEQQMLALGQLVGSVAHEINNLIHPIVNLTKRLRNRFAQTADPESMRLMELIDMSSRQAAKVVSELLHSTRDQRWKDVRRPLSLAVEYGVEAVRPALPASVRIDVVTEDVASPTVKVGDILQVVGNLLSNAVHAMDGKGTVSIALSRVDEGGRLTVADDGAGMDETVRRRAMQPFFTTKTDGRGTGVGLYVVQKIVQDYGGWITIDSSPGLGTTFTILFPSREDDNGEFGQQADGSGRG